MTSDSPFLQTILDHPDDDLPRLVYADWLEEHGATAQAEFIRAECQLFRLRKFDADFTPLQARLRRSWSEIDPSWTAQLGMRRLLHAHVRRPYWTAPAVIEATGEGSPRMVTMHRSSRVSLRICPYPEMAQVLFEDRCRRRIWVSEYANGVIDGIRQFLLERWTESRPLGSVRIQWIGQRDEPFNLLFGSIKEATVNALRRALPPAGLVRVGP